MIIAKFLNMKIEITWTLLLICFDSYNLLLHCKHQNSFISSSEIINYAIDMLNFSDDDKIISLAILKENEHKEILKLLKQLSKNENCNYAFEFKKFRVMYIHKNLPKPNDNFMHGILKISEIWSEFGFPEDSPNKYYKFKMFSPTIFKELIDLNTIWLIKEFSILKILN